MIASVALHEIHVCGMHVMWQLTAWQAGECTVHDYMYGTAAWAARAAPRYRGFLFYIKNKKTYAVNDRRESKRTYPVPTTSVGAADRCGLSGS